MTYQAPIEVDSDGELILVLPDEMVEELNWNIGDKLVWRQLDDGNWSLKKREDSNS